MSTDPDAMSATQITLNITQRVPFADGHDFGGTGPFEAVSGRISVGFDPKSPRYSSIVDIDKAPSADGLARYETDFYLIKPTDLASGNRRLLFDVVNRGDKRALQFFNDAPAGNAPATLAHAGNGFLFREGYTVLWCGWQGDVRPGEGRATLDVPVASGVTGRVREEFIIETSGVVTTPISGKAHTRSHPANDLDNAAAELSARPIEGGIRTRVPNDQWSFATVEAGEVVSSATDIYVAKGFKPGWIYELCYVAKDPATLGLGFAAVRDCVEFFRSALKDHVGTPNPLAMAGASGIERAYAWGRSQSGRYLREFVYRGWNVATDYRRVFDAIWPHVTGAGRLALNLRFAHPDKFPRQYEDHLYPSDQFPFAYVPTTDPFSGKVDALLRRPSTDPLVIHTQTSSEYWQRRGSLVHTDAFGNDLPPHPNVRCYHFAGSQHHAAPGIPAQAGPHRHPSNPLNTSPLLRALLVRLDAWASEDIPPPPSAIPRRTDGTLTPARDLLAQFNVRSDIAPPSEPNKLCAQDYGPMYDDGIVTIDPPSVDESDEYAVLVPATDEDGNEVGRARTPDLAVPLATYTGWNFRTNPPELNGEMPMFSIVGSYFPFPQTESERERTNDARASIEARYPTAAAYVRHVVRAVETLKDDGFLLDEDADRFVHESLEHARTRWPTDGS